MNHNLYELLETGFPADRNHACLILPSGDTHSYSDVERASGRYANMLLSLGLQKGDRVVAQLEKTPEAVFLYLACLRAGLVYVPVNPAYRATEVRHMLLDAQPRLFVHQSDIPDAAAVAQSCLVPHTLELCEHGMGTLPELAAGHGPSFETAHCEATDVGAILYTSGTTGRSKGAMLTHGNLSSNVQALEQCWQWRSYDVLLHMLPIFHVHGLFVALNGALLNGNSIFFEPKFDVERALRVLPQVTLFMGVPTYYKRLLDNPAFTKEVCSSLRLFVSGSAPLSIETFQSFTRRTGHVILERYGMTETNILTSNPYNTERRGGTVGFAVPGTQLRIVDADGLRVVPGEIGSIQVKGPSVFAGYWRQPEKSRAEFTADGFFKTGDMGFIDPEGYLTIVGRSKDLIITGGLNVYPKEVEERLNKMPGILESAVIGVPHPDFGEAVTAVIVSPSDRDERSIIASLKQELASYKVPKRVHFVRELPRNALGKVQKNLLRQRFTDSDPTERRAPSPHRPQAIEHTLLP